MTESISEELDDPGKLGSCIYGPKSPRLPYPNSVEFVLVKTVPVEQFHHPGWLVRSGKARDIVLGSDELILSGHVEGPKR